MRNITIFTGKTRRAASWAKREMSFNALCLRLANPVRGKETVNEYQALNREQKGELKDVGGFVGGSLKGGIRSKQTVEFRDLLTIDMDSVPSTDEFVNRINESIGNPDSPLFCSYCYYTTRSHTPSKPRFRLVIPLDRQASPEEYNAAARKLCELAGLLDFCDPTTFDPSRLMYWGSACLDGEYICRSETEAPWLMVDILLAEYDDWTDCSCLPKTRSEAEQTCTEALKRKAANPLEKSGWIGAFCSSFDIYRAIDTFLSHIYAKGSAPDRYTYLKGSTSDGAIVYDKGAFLYSNHATDPAAGRSVNSFDLVRIHVFGDRDAGKSETTPVDKMPSYKAMMDFCRSYPEVQRKKIEEKLIAAQSDFIDTMDSVPATPDMNTIDAYINTNTVKTDIKVKTDAVRSSDAAADFGASTVVAETTAERLRIMDTGNTENKPETLKALHEKMRADTSWLVLLAVDKKGGIISSLANVVALLENCPYFKGRLKRDTFADRILAEGPMPWRSRSCTLGEFEWQQDDYINFRLYCSRIGLKCSAEDIRASIAGVLSYNSYDSLRDYVMGLRGKWDGMPRMETYFVDTLGAHDNYYVRTATRKQIIALVARALCPGIKYDTMLILYGPQGIGKSTALRRLARFGGREQDKGLDWYLNATGNMEGREFTEKLQGQWLVELSELNSLNKSDSDKIKDCLSSYFDMYRKPYDIDAVKRYRRCVFFGTTNDMEFLKDPTGRRRFNPIKCEGTGIMDVFSMKDDYIDQIFAEALDAYEKGESLEAGKEFNDWANSERMEYDMIDPIESFILNYLGIEFPLKWYKYTLADQRRFLDNPTCPDFGEETLRKKLDSISIIELWVHALRKDRYSITWADKKRIKSALLRMGWVYAENSAKGFGEFKSQKYFCRPSNIEGVDEEEKSE